MPAKSGIALRWRARNALSEQPVSRIVSPESLFRTPLAIRDCILRHAESRRPSR